MTEINTPRQIFLSACRWFMLTIVGLMALFLAGFMLAQAWFWITVGWEVGS